MSFGEKNMQKGREKGENVKEKGREKGEKCKEKGRKGKMRKGEVKE
jgi:hypothetical protein